jgi:hypothetical protein
MKIFEGVYKWQAANGGVAELVDASKRLRGGIQVRRGASPQLSGFDSRSGIVQKLVACRFEPCSHHNLAKQVTMRKLFLSIPDDIDPPVVIKKPS